jgi:DNA-binding NarL/FixJ family response regulator
MSYNHSHMPADLLDVVIFDRREFDRSALRALCRHDASLSLVAMVDNEEEAAASLNGRGGSTVVLVGRTALRDAGRAIVDRLHRCVPRPRVVLVAIGDDRSLQRDAVRLGVDGVLQCDGDLDDQLAVVHGGSQPESTGVSGPTAAG